jgi:hypothetical protein
MCSGWEGRGSNMRNAGRRAGQPSVSSRRTPGSITPGRGFCASWLPQRASHSRRGVWVPGRRHANAGALAQLARDDSVYLVVIASEAKQSRVPRRLWIASAVALRAMADKSSLRSSQ